MVRQSSEISCHPRAYKEGIIRVMEAENLNKFFSMLQSPLKKHLSLG